MKLSVLNQLIDVLKNKVDDDHFTMGNWLKNIPSGCSFSIYRGEEQIPHCKTAGCIAGWVVLGVMTPKERKPYTISRAHTVDMAKKHLGFDDVTEYDASRQLFNPSRVLDIEKVKREDAIKVLEHLRDTGKVDWSVTGLTTYPIVASVTFEA